MNINRQRRYNAAKDPRQQPTEPEPDKWACLRCYGTTYILETFGHVRLHKTCPSCHGSGLRSPMGTP